MTALTAPEKRVGQKKLTFKVFYHSDGRWKKSKPKFCRVKISKHCFGKTEKDLFKKICREELFFVDNEAFHQPDAEKKIMTDSGDWEEKAKPPRFIFAIADPIGDLEENILKPVVLSAEEEKKLFLQYNYCRFRFAQLIENSQGKVLGRRYLMNVIYWFSKILQLRDSIINANLPLVLAMARRMRLPNVDFAELVSEGNMALLRSVDKFDISRGFKFSSYCCRAILKAFSRASMGRSRYRKYFPVEFDPEMEKSDFLERRRQKDADDLAEKIHQCILENTAGLNEVEQTILQERFKMPILPSDNGKVLEEKTLEEVGHIVGLTKERVRQIQNEGLLKIREALGIDERKPFTSVLIQRFRVRQRRPKKQKRELDKI